MAKEKNCNVINIAWTAILQNFEFLWISRVAELRVIFLSNVKKNNNNYHLSKKNENGDYYKKL